MRMRPDQIAANGAWLGVNELGHFYDVPLCLALAKFFRGCTVGDFGCGNGSYVRGLRSNGINVHGFDGNPQTGLLEPGCEVLDLSEKVELATKFDWVLSLEVGEHIPPQFEGVFIDNLHRHNTRGMVLSWALEGQPGDGHVNCHNNDYIRDILHSLGYRSDIESEQELRRSAEAGWLARTLMVFRK